MGKLFFAELLLLILFFTETTRSSLGGGSALGCIEGERQALLKFKQSLSDPSRSLSSWNSTTEDCCKWKGVRCNGITGHVVKLDLRNLDASGYSLLLEPIDEYAVSSTNNSMLEAPEVNSCLLELKYLNYLDLSGNNFENSPIPNFFGSMRRLRYLNLSSANFSGMVPHHLGNLSGLRVLDLRNPLRVDDLIWVSRLSSLQHLDMSGVDLSQAGNLMKVLNMLPSILELHLSSCRLDNIHLSHAYVNSTLPNLQNLDLSGNSFEGKFPTVLRNMTSLRDLDLSVNYFNYSVPLFLGNFKSLVHLNLGGNRFNHIEGGLSRILESLCDLKSLDMSSNLFQGDMLKRFQNLSGCVRYNLERLNLGGGGFGGCLPDWLGQLRHLKYLDLGFNRFYGPIPASLWSLTGLKELYLYVNQLNGTIPVSLGHLTELEVLYLTRNQLSGSIPVSLGQLSNLKKFDISFNLLEGVVSEAHFANLSMLKDMTTSSNFLTFKVRPDWIPPFQLKYLRMRSCKIGSQFPQWLQTQKEVVTLYLSNASISGTLPEWLPDMHMIRDLDLSDNLLSGPLPQNIGDMMPTLESLLLAGNLINGSIPNSLCRIKTLQALDLSKNRLSGYLPRCWKLLQELMVLRLASNRLTGVIPNSIGHLSSLQWLHLNNNNLYGELPLALRNCTALVVLDLGENGFSGNIPGWIGENLTFLQVLRLRKNMFNGSIPSQLCLLDYGLQIMDLADNDLTGTIPRCFGNLRGMVFKPYPGILLLEWDNENMMQVIKGRELEYTKTLVLVVNMDLSSNNLVGKIPAELTLLSGLIGLNLSHNHLTGSIPMKVGDMKSLESLDFSSNHLSGMIPQSISDLTSLSLLNLSYNNFSGRIPTGSQLQTLNDPSFYVGNPELCGDPLPKKCPGDESAQAPTTTSYEEKDEEDEAEKVWFYLVVMSGFATGLWGVVGVLLFKKSWRHAYFGFVDVTKDKILLAIAVRVAKLKMKRNHIEG
uniref:Putative Disease resistance family protein / LRR family protein n=1 Tax=Davidia involucrata TaxID=16924 RepID=A0A5B7BRY8_DAVIN